MGTFTQYLSSVFDWLLASTLQVSILVCILLVIEAVIRTRLSARWQYCLWLLLMVRILMPWLPQSNISLFNMMPSPGKTTTVNMTVHKPIEKVWPVDVQTKTEINDTKPHVAEDTLSWGQLTTGSVEILPIVWLAGAMVLAGYIFVGYLNFWRAVKFKRPLTNQRVLDLLEDCKEQMSVQTILGIVVTDKVNSPALFGFIRPRLLLPTGMIEKLSLDELRYVFLHELAHLKRHDIGLGWLAALCQVLHWFNPLVWVAFWRMRADRELACDALALSSIAPEQSNDYGQTILRLLESFTQFRRLPALAGVLEDKSQLKRRITMIAKFKKPSTKWSLLAIALIALLSCVVLTNAQQTAEEKQPQKLAKEFVQLLVEGRFTKAAENFDTTMKNALPAEKLEQTWKSTTSLAGVFGKQLGTRTEKFLGSDIIYVTCQFEKGPLDVKVVYNADKQISGLFFVPVPQQILQKYQESQTKSSNEKIDIKIENFDINTVYEGKDLYRAIVSIHNDNNISTPEIHIRYYRSDPKNNLNERGETHSGYHIAGPLKPGQQWNESTGPFEIPDGIHQFFVILDYENKISETNENNNQASLRITVKDGRMVEKTVQLPSVQEESKEDVPKVVTTSPDALAEDVEPTLDKITVTFDREMMDGSWSWTGGGDTFPQKTGKIYYDQDKKTCTMPVKLQPGKVYWVGINSPSHNNFKTPENIPAKRYVIVFATKTEDGKPTPIPREMLERAERINNTAKVEGDSIAPTPLASKGKQGKLAVLSYDDGKSDGKKSVDDSGHAVMFEAPTQSCILRSIRIYGSRYGQRKPPKEDFKIWLCDENFKVIKEFAMPYSRFTRGNAKWVSLRVEPTEVPETFAICAGFNPEKAKGVYVHYDDSSSGNSFTGLPGEEMSPFNDGEWMIQAIVRQPYKGTDTELEEAASTKDSLSPIGNWESVDFVRNIEDFKAGQKNWQGELFLKEVSFYKGGKTSSVFSWRDNYIIDKDSEIEAEYYIKQIDGQTWLFLPWLSGDVTIRGQKPKYYVLKKI